MSSNEKKEAIPDGMSERWSDLVERIKRSPGYTKYIGIQLGIERMDAEEGREADRREVEEMKRRCFETFEELSAALARHREEFGPTADAWPEFLE